MSLQPPGDLGRRLLPAFVDQVAATDPDRTVYSFMKTNDAKDGFHNVSAKTFASAVNRCAHDLEQSLGRGTDFPTLLYMGPQDPAYPIIAMACVKAGYKAFFSSPMNELQAQLNLLEETDCHTFLLPPDFSPPIVKDITAARKMTVLEVHSFLKFISDETPVEQYPYTKTWEEGALEPLMVLHTSGSTGWPKPVTITHKTLAALDAFNAAPSLGYPNVFPNVCKGLRAYMGMPYFHMSGVIMSLHAPWLAEFTSVSGPFPPRPEVVNSVHTHGDVHYSVQGALIWTRIAQNPEYLEPLERLQGAAWGGGPCPKEVGDTITKKVQMWNCIGSTETGLLPNQRLDSADWSYFSPSPLMRHEFRQVTEELHELYIVRDPDLEVYQGVFGTFPELKEYPTKDLYSKHPTKPTMWHHEGRSDDIIVLSSRDKVNPLDMEGMLLSHPSISAALVAGYGYPQPSLLVETKEPPQTTQGQEDLVNEIWPSVEAANKVVPPHARVQRDLIMFTSPERPMRRAGKGTVQRRLTLDDYSEEVKTLYSRLDQ